MFLITTGCRPRSFIFFVNMILPRKEEVIGVRHRLVRARFRKIILATKSTSLLFYWMTALVNSEDIALVSKGCESKISFISRRQVPADRVFDMHRTILYKYQQTSESRFLIFCFNPLYLRHSPRAKTYASRWDARASPMSAGKAQGVGRW